MKLSICIPTYNRATHLNNCLHSIFLNQGMSHVDFQVCVSDNCSTDHTEQVVQKAQENLDIKYQISYENIVRVRNYINVIEMADGDFIWMIGDDDLLLPNTLVKLSALIKRHPTVEFFYINSFHLTTEYVASFPQPFDTTFLLPKDMRTFSSWTKSGEMPFMRLIDPRISFDFLGGMFLAVFKRDNWMQHVNVLDKKAVLDSSSREFSHFDNTFPHVKVFAIAFASSQAYFHAEALSVCLTGAREWAPMSPLVMNVRLIEILDEYRKNGLSFARFVYCKNFALRTFIPGLISMFLHKETSGYLYIDPLQLIKKNLFYPNTYLSFFYYCARKLKSYSKYALTLVT